MADQNSNIDPDREEDDSDNSVASLSELQEHVDAEIGKINAKVEGMSKKLDGLIPMLMGEMEKRFGRGRAETQTSEGKGKNVNFETTGEGDRTHDSTTAIKRMDKVAKMGKMPDGAIERHWITWGRFYLNTTTGNLEVAVANGDFDWQTGRGESVGSVDLAGGSWAEEEGSNVILVGETVGLSLQT